MMRVKRIDQYRPLRESGMSYREIGKLFGVSAAAVYDTINKNRDGFHEDATRKVKYVGLRDWMLVNRVGVKDLAVRSGIRRETLYNNLVGKGGINKRTIDAILRVTGLTYEECFTEEVDDAQ